MYYPTFEEQQLDEMGEDALVGEEGRIAESDFEVDDEFGMESEAQQVLLELFESDELLNEGVLSFEYPLLLAEDAELDLFLGKLIKKATRAVGSVAKSVGRGVTSVAKTVGKGVSAIDKIVPVSTLINASPIGMAVRAGVGAVKAVAEGRNVFQAAMRGLAADPVSRFLVDTGAAAARGENIVKAAQKAAQAGIGDVRKSLQFAAMVAPFVPGIGTGVAAALGAANALASGQNISEALISAARSAVPGGAVAQMAFDTAMNLAKGKNVGEALLNSARSRLPGGPAAQAAFDAAVTLAKGKSIQDAALAATGRLLPKSPYSADVMSFVKKVASGENIQRAALSGAGNFILNKVQQQAGASFPKIAGASSLMRGASSVQAARARAAQARRLAAGLPREVEDFELQDEAPEAQEAVDFESVEDGVFGETEELQLASELLEVADESELDQFLGRLIARAVGRGRSCAAAPALRQILRQVARRSLPLLGSGFIQFSNPGAGRQLAAAAGNLFGLELEGMSEEDKEFESARRFVRFAGAGARQARRLGRSGPARAVAKRALGAAARRHAPGLLRKPRRPRPLPVPPRPNPGSRLPSAFDAGPEPLTRTSDRIYARPVRFSVTCQCGNGGAPVPADVTPADPASTTDPASPPAPGDTGGSSADPADGGDSGTSSLPDNEPANASNQQTQTTKEHTMHDLDRTSLEVADEASDYEFSEFDNEDSEYSEDNEYSEGGAEAAFTEEEEAELAAELLEINDEQELDQFIGSLLKKAKKVVGGALKSPLLKPLGGFIKGAIKKVLPVAGGALGNLVVPGLGGAIGSQLASGAGSMLGLELENASPEDQEFEVAKQVVRLAGAAVQNAAQLPGAVDPQAAAKAAMVAAAQTHAPGLLQPASGAPRGPRTKSGRWFRRGNKIVLVGV